MSRNNSLEQSMTPKEQSIVDQKLREVAEILYKNTPKEELATFETIEYREMLLAAGRE